MGQTPLAKEQENLDILPHLWNMPAATKSQREQNQANGGLPLRESPAITRYLLD